MPAIEAILWRILNKGSCIQFGKDCGGAACWTIFSMSLAYLLHFSPVMESFVPKGLIFGFPCLIQIISRHIPILKERNPILTVRIAESLVAKDGLAKTFLLLPAHMLGSVIGLVWFRTLIPFVSKETISPMYCEDKIWLVALGTEIIVNFVYVITLLVLPYLLEVNRLSIMFVSVPLLPAILFSDSCFNPSIIYGLWSINSNIFGTTSCDLNIIRIGGALLGALIAGWVTSTYFPDDSSSWSRKSKK